MTSKKKGAKKPTTKPSWSLTECALAYLESLRAARKSESTISAYAADLDLATEVLGAETPISQLSLADVERFNTSEPVLRTKSGRDKAMPTIERSRRVLRLALVFAVQQGALESAPIAEKPKREPRPVAEAMLPPIVERKKRAKESLEPAAAPAPVTEDAELAGIEAPVEASV